MRIHESTAQRITDKYCVLGKNNVCSRAPEKTNLNICNAYTLHMACERESGPEIKYYNLYGEEKLQSVFYFTFECITDMEYTVDRNIIIISCTHICNIYDNAVKYNNIWYTHSIIIYVLLEKISYSFLTVGYDWEYLPICVVYHAAVWIQCNII